MTIDIRPIFSFLKCPKRFHLDIELFRLIIVQGCVYITISNISIGFDKCRKSGIYYKGNNLIGGRK